MRDELVNLLYEDNNLPMWLVEKTIALVRSMRYKVARELWDEFEMDGDNPQYFPNWLNRQEKK